MSYLDNTICSMNNIKLAEIFLFANNYTYLGKLPPADVITTLTSTKSEGKVETLKIFSTIPGNNLTYTMSTNFGAKKTQSLEISGVSKNFLPINCFIAGKKYPVGSTPASTDCTLIKDKKSIGFSHVFNNDSNTIEIFDDVSSQNNKIKISGLSFPNLNIATESVKNCNPSLIPSDITLPDGTVIPGSTLLAKIIVTYVECV